MNLDGDALSQIYGQCAAELRLSAEGAFHVQRNEVDEYCGGPCLEETKLALQCVDDFPSKRPNMLQVVAMLRELDDAQPPTTEPAAPPAACDTPEDG